MSRTTDILEVEIERQKAMIEDLQETCTKYLMRARTAEEKLKTLIDTLLSDEGE